MKLILFDVDGTITYRKNGKEIIPNSTKIAIQKLKENGNIIAIASGRQFCKVKYIADELGINNIISDGGNCLSIDDKIIYLDYLDKNKCNQITSECIKKKVPFGYLISPFDSTVYTNSFMLSNKTVDYMKPNPVQIKNDFDYVNTNCNKLYLGIDIGDESILDSIDCTKIERYFNWRLAYEEYDKFKGVNHLLHFYNIDIKDSFFFGDGKNDVLISKKVGMSIAMGNGSTQLKKVASYITDSIENDGVYVALKKLELI